jgi:16S rRNA (uracil1498-N3)-methyltransferase
VHDILELETACTAIGVRGGELRLMLVPEAGEALASLASRILRSVALLVGPEGGLSEREQGLAQRAGFQPCALGPRILRTETAPLAALAALQVLAGDLGTP